jgi:iron complex outermembrane recepter protein
MNKRSHFVFLVLAIGFILALGDVTALFAQETKAEEFTLEEITVTAQKRAENQQKVPIAMETISGDTIKELGKSDIDQILSTVSSIIVNTASDGMRVSLRGMSNDNPAFQGRQVSTPTVAVNMDGAYTNRNAAGGNLYDVERVEVLYGPQSTLYSTSSPGGVVNVVTASPKLDRFEGTANLEAGNYNLKNGQFSVNVPVMSKLALRLAGSYSKRDGYLSDGKNDDDNKSARLKALFQATDKLSFTAIGEVSKIGGVGFGGAQVFDYQDGHYINSDGSLGAKVTNPWLAQVATGPDANAGPAPNNDQVNYKYSGRIDWDLGLGSLAIIPSYTPRDNNTIRTGVDNQNVATVSYNSQKGSEKSVEARMTSSADFTAFKWIAGAAYYHSWDESSGAGYYAATGLSNGQSNYGYENQRSTAVFANVTYPVTDQLRATGGLRYTKANNYSYNFESGRNNNLPETVNQEYGAPDYKVGVEYDLAENSMLYSDFATSYRIQGMGTRPDGSAFPNEKLKAITVGAKNRFFGKRMQVNASAYYYIYKNYMAVTGVGTVTDNYVGISPQTGLPVAANDGHLQYVDNDNDGKFTIGTDTPLDGISTGNGPGQDGTAQDENAKQVGDAKVYGLDIQTTTMVTQNFKVDLSVSYLKKYFTKLYYNFLPITNELGIPDLDYSGKDMTFAPHWTVTLSLNYNMALWNGGTLTPRLDSRFQSSYKMYFLDTKVGVSRTQAGVLQITQMDLSKAATQEPYHVSDFTLVYAHPTGNWTLTGYIKNLEDYAVKRSIEVQMNAGNMSLGAPRTYGGILSVKF